MHRLFGRSYVALVVAALIAPLGLATIGCSGDNPPEGSISIPQDVRSKGPGAPGSENASTKKGMKGVKQVAAEAREKFQEQEKPQP